MAINLTPFFAKMILRINPFRRILVVCSGYGDDYKNFTELGWQEDKDLDFYEKDLYPQFQLWL
jgi:hypothetical protein